MNITRSQTPYWDVGANTSSADIRSAFERAGFVVLRQPFAPDKLRKYAHELAAEFARLQAVRAQLPLELVQSLDRDELSAHDELSRFRLTPGNYAHLTDSELLKRTLGALLGGDHLWHFPFQARRMNPAHACGHLPYHQDCAYTLHYPRFLTCWLPLIDTGEHAPGLEVLAANVTEKLGHNVEGRWEAKLVQALPPQYANAQVVRPITQLGDVIIFNELTLHKTFVSPGMNQLRYSMDARCIRADTLTPELATRRRFVRSGEAQFHAR
jgi:hypothetical protein